MKSIYLKRDFLEDFLVELCCFNTTNPPGNETELAVFIAEFLKKNGIADVKIMEVCDKRSNVIAKVERNPGGPFLAFSGHLDVVPATSEWKTNPFIATIEKDLLYARGSCDMKGGIAAMLAAFLELNKKPDFEGNLMFIGTCDEEVGCKGIQHFIENFKDSIEISSMLIGEATSNHIANGEKGALWLKVSCKGIAAHGSQPELGKNAIIGLIDIIQKIRISDFFDRNDITYSINMIEGGTKENIVADHATTIIDMRFEPTLNSQMILDALREITFNFDIDIEPVLLREPFLTDAGSKITKVCLRVLEANNLATEKNTMSYFTDGAFISNLNIPTIIIGPGDPKMNHKVNEYVNINDVTLSAKLFYEIADNYFQK